MGLGFTKVASTGDIPVWQHDKALQLAQGGFALDRTGYDDGDIIKAGTPMIFSEATRTAKPLITGVLHANATSSATDYQVKKGHKFEVGKYFSARTGSKAYAITAIDTDDEDYDVITVGTTLGTALTAGDMVYASSTTGASNSSFGGVNGLLYTDCIVADGESVSVVIRGTVYARRVPYSADLEAALPRIIFSQSF